MRDTPIPERKTLLLLGLLLCTVFVVYLDHFENSFHFDDQHTVVENPYIRDLRNVPRFFTDARTFSVLPQNRVYRPLVSTSLALDFWLGGGLKPFYFQASTFYWFVVQLVLMYALFRRICEVANPDPRNRTVALLATAWYGLHPAMAETVNYVIQRADVFSTLGVIAGVVMYASAPKKRRFGLYLFPVVAGILSKPPALIFPAILFVYIWLFEEDADPLRLGRTLLRTTPALLISTSCAVLLSGMTPKSFNPGVTSAYAYRITQPLVALRYFRTFFLPGGLTADTDLTPIPSIWTDWAWVGFLFLLAWIALAVVCSSRRLWRPVAFGMWWFLLALVPISIFPLAEVENDHRMYFPFVGLVLSASWPVALWIYHLESPRRALRVALALVCFGELATLALGTWQRNIVWRTEESLWHDVTIKSPRNARGLRNYGVTLGGRGDDDQALAYLQRAEADMPGYWLDELNTGIFNGKLKRGGEAELHFRRALEMMPDDPRAHYFYARWLGESGREKEAIEELRLSVKANPDFLESTYSLIEIYAKRRSWEIVRRLTDYLLARFPSDGTAQSYRLMAAWETGELADLHLSTRSLADNFLAVSALRYDAGEYDQSILAAKEALKLRPNLPQAFNNIATAYRAQDNWEAAAEAARQALHLQPTYKMAQENLARALAHTRDPYQ